MVGRVCEGPHVAAAGSRLAFLNSITVTVSNLEPQPKLLHGTRSPLHRLSAGFDSFVCGHVPERVTVPYDVNQRARSTLKPLPESLCEMALQDLTEALSHQGLAAC
jgi:hypothetical protein